MTEDDEIQRRWLTVNRELAAIARQKTLSDGDEWVGREQQCLSELDQIEHAAGLRYIELRRKEIDG